MSNKYFDGIVNNPKVYEPVDEELINTALEMPKKVINKMDDFKSSDALDAIFTLLRRTNKYIDETMPWALAKEEKTEELKSAMYHLIENLRKIAILIKSFMTDTADNILRQIGITDTNSIKWKDIYAYDTLKDMKVIEKGEPIFMRLNVEEEVEYLKSVMKK